MSRNYPSALALESCPVASIGGPAGHTIFLRLYAQVWRLALYGLDHLPVLVRLDAARRIDDRAAGADAPGGHAQQARLQTHQLPQVTGPQTPARLRALAQHAGIAARYVHQHAVERSRRRFLASKPGRFDDGQ